MSLVSTINPASASALPVFTLINASSYVDTFDTEELYSPDMFKFPVIVTSPIIATAPVLPVNAKGVFVTPPSLIVKLKF